MRHCNGKAVKSGPFFENGEQSVKALLQVYVEQMLQSARETL